MTKEQCVPGTRVRYTGDEDNFGESFTIPQKKNALGTVVRRTSDFDDQTRWDVLVIWDEPVDGVNEYANNYFYKAESLSPAHSAGF